jgi:hypothetical protein
VFLHRRTTLFVLAGGIAVLAGGVAVAASSHTLPTAAGGGQTPTTATSRAPHTPPDATTAGTAAPAAPADATTAKGQGPDATGPAKFGLCTAYSSGQGTTNGGKADSVAFQALATAAGGSANIATFCADATPGGDTREGDGGTTQGSTPSAGAANANAAEHATPTSDAHGPGSDSGSQGQSHGP